jgi:SAM-dependent methyltransferase
MTGETLYCDPQFAQLYDWDNPWPEDFDFFASLAAGASRVLDLGCGTGIFSTELAARGHEVTGADPAAAMLQIARDRQGGGMVRWIEADARSLDLGESFDMVLMTGHAFQTLLSCSDRRALIGTIARHLASGGRFFFDNRNPEAREWEQWTPEVTREVRPHHQFGSIERWTDANCNPFTGIVTYGTFYQFESGRLLSARSQIAFAPQTEIAWAGSFRPKAPRSFHSARAKPKAKRFAKSYGPKLASKPIPSNPSCIRHRSKS